MMMEEVLGQVLTLEGITVPGEDLVPGNAQFILCHTCQVVFCQVPGAAVIEDKILVAVGKIYRLIGIIGGPAHSLCPLFIDLDQRDVGLLGAAEHAIVKLLAGNGGLIPFLGIEVFPQKLVFKKPAVAGENLIASHAKLSLGQMIDVITVQCPGAAVGKSIVHRLGKGVDIAVSGAIQATILLCTVHTDQIQIGLFVAIGGKAAGAGCVPAAAFEISLQIGV